MKKLGKFLQLRKKLWIKIIHHYSSAMNDQKRQWKITFNFETLWEQKPSMTSHEYFMINLWSSLVNGISTHGRACIKSPLSEAQDSIHCRYRHCLNVSHFFFYTVSFLKTGIPSVLLPSGPRRWSLVKGEGSLTEYTTEDFCTQGGPAAGSKPKICPSEIALYFGTWERKCNSKRALLWTEAMGWGGAP